jgi:hypothetical protein
VPALSWMAAKRWSGSPVFERMAHEGDDPDGQSIMNLAAVGLAKAFEPTKLRLVRSLVAFQLVSKPGGYRRGTVDRPLLPSDDASRLPMKRKRTKTLSPPNPSGPASPVPVPPARRELLWVGLILGFSALLRLVIALLNDAANDNHLQVVQLMLAGSCARGPPSTSAGSTSRWGLSPPCFSCLAWGWPCAARERPLYANGLGGGYGRAKSQSLSACCFAWAPLDSSSASRPCTGISAR